MLPLVSLQRASLYKCLPTHVAGVRFFFGVNLIMCHEVSFVEKPRTTNLTLIGLVLQVCALVQTQRVTGGKGPAASVTLKWLLARVRP